MMSWLKGSNIFCEHLLKDDQIPSLCTQVSLYKFITIDRYAKNLPYSQSNGVVYGACLDGLL